MGDPTHGKGTRGGFRYMYYYIERDGQVFLLMIFSKNEQADLTDVQKKALKQAILGNPGDRRDVFRYVSHRVQSPAAFEKCS